MRKLVQMLSVAMPKILVSFAIISICLLHLWAQVKIDEFPQTDSDSEAARLDTFFAELHKQPASTGLVIIYSGLEIQRIGNITPLIRGIQNYARFRNFDLKRITIKIAKGREPMEREFWVIPANSQPPKIDLAEIKFNNLRGPRLFADVCVSCEPAVAGLDSFSVDSELLAKILIEDPQLAVSIVITPGYYPGSSKREALLEARQYAAIMRTDLASRKISKERIRFRIEPVRSENPLEAKFYLIPIKYMSKS